MSQAFIVTQSDPQPLGAIQPSFVVGQDGDGRWVAVESHGRGGGLFRSRRDAVHYALAETLRRSDAVTFSADRVECRM